MLKKIKEFLEIGKIYFKKLSYNRRRGIKARDQYVYSITHSKDLLKLKEILDSCKFHTKKAKDKAIFFEVLISKLKKEHLTLEGNDNIIKIVRTMNSGMRDNFKAKT